MVFDYPTNYSNGITIEGVYDFFLGFPSYILNDWYASGFILLIWVSVFGLMSFSGSNRALSVASFISAIFAIWFVAAGLLNFVVPISLIILTIIGALGAKSDKGL